MSGSGRHDGRGRLGNTLSNLAVAVGCVLFLGGFAWGAVVYKPYTVPTDSMTPTVNAGDRVLAERVDGGDVRRGDVVVFTDSTWGDVPMVKRVVGVGGDKVACCDKDGRLTVNGEPVEEPYLHAKGASSLIGTDDKAPASPQDFTADVPEGRIFVLGDERSTSMDSRVHLQDPGQGTVPRSAVEARVDAVAWPMNGMIGRPAAFAALPGGVSSEGPLPLQVGALLVGVVLILGGAAHGPLSARSARKAERPKASAGAH
ncbi:MULTISPECIES: signal peptidase I [Streptomyces]|uniref:Signal peptidase I n=1 Tax=Streptomyces glycanivorans TaxID=3033808 RepID=A0ABY9JD17_9ACTN|nr:MULTISPECIES: signal peptidase I [unclassified Streptomyces]WSQ77274.1 signal peptidase I [Streptomyces sp. NBC_01213]TXS18301.1 signal peptidase I [Streptomyces sp. wa22]WLQ63886.1 signal peptidase I [Streptomyces sp. Alt3]WSQ84605.1 signal peptidase I [Streptomyces sp. NBC_01212]WSR09282.1 signal peptidase I [Streptomyces sp. NBC_01208]